MKFWIRLNLIGALYGLLPFVVLEMMVNVYRLSRLSGLSLKTVIVTIAIINLLVMSIITALVLFLIKRWMANRKSTYWSLLFWIPYFILFVILFTLTFPITDPGEIPNPGIGLLVMGTLIFYPFYMLLVNYFGLNQKNSTTKASKDNKMNLS
ncbi:hypothetical protein [Aquibacillus kalidii]|uniref:hypothetical protein n=1 Tax=Aquibacillus kalidii TaxID=2762597 RepID=UPI0016482343|nr:hypothetical protein [Aquibacillus kalidii]